MATTLTYPPQQRGNKLTCSKYSRGRWLNPALYCNTWVKRTETAAGKSRPFHLKLINSSSLKKQPPTSSPLVTVHSVIHRASFLFSEPRLATAVMCAALCMCHTLTSLLLIARWSDQSRSEAPLWAKQVTHGQGRCQHHRCCEFSRAKSVSLRWAVKLDIINPVQSRASRLPAGRVCCHNQWNNKQPNPVGNLHTVVRISPSWMLDWIGTLQFPQHSMDGVWPPNTGQSRSQLTDIKCYKDVFTGSVYTWH